MTEQELRTEQELCRALERFASKPDDALETAKVSAAVLSCSERTLRYHPRAKRIYITQRRYAYRVGNIREIARGGGVAEQGYAEPVKGTA